MRVWKPIRGYEGYYEVSDDGEVRSLIKWHGTKYIKRENKKMLKKTKTTTGYFKVELCKNKTKKSIRVHRLVAMAFVPNNDMKNRNIVNHIDRNILNNKASNLNWCTTKENAIYSVAIHRRHKLKKEDEEEMIKMYLSRKPIKKILDRFKISGTTLYNTLKRKNISRYSLSERKLKYYINKDDLKEKLKTMSNKEISKEYNCDQSLISVYKKRLNEKDEIYSERRG